MKITVKDIVDLIRISCHVFQIRIFALNTTFWFMDDEIPDEVLGMQVKSINNPQLHGNEPLCLNLYYGEFENFDRFKHNYRWRIVR